ncbi:cytochrome P450 [Penicillium malachiteum]|uniref:cytochrome P450 n=1 Tax=Penicillium malachiteum TaxID=1324776 RepID=UPI002549264B|nr:cytochrome P450 [Penicillium malachiteum]KAJ5715186.1 cytochrome P450 [Penicillium malachiteum]
MEGARLHLNTWAIGHDHERHENPEEFRPERYDDDDTSSLQSANQADSSKRDHFAFGSGRRMCAGISIAERSFSVAIMRILWAFDITPKPGTTLPVDNSQFPGELPGIAGTSMPVMLTPRSDEKVRLIDARSCIL